MSDTPGNAPQNGPRQAMKSPRAALEPEAAPPPPPASRHARNQWVVIGNLIITIALVVLVGGMAGFLYFNQALTAPGPLQQDRAVFIERGSNAETIAQTLERNGVINSALIFSAAVQRYGVRNDLKWGEYLFPKGVSTAEALAIVLEGKAIEYRITVPEGLTRSRSSAACATTTSSQARSRASRARARSCPTPTASPAARPASRSST